MREEEVRERRECERGLRLELEIVIRKKNIDNKSQF